MEEIQVPNFQGMGEQLLNEAVIYASVTGLNFFKDSFNQQGWTGINFEPWQPVDGKNGQGILINTAFLRDSTQIASRTPTKIEFINTAPYSGIHNDGGTITVRITPRSRKFFWYMFKATGKIKWKKMALTKKKTMAIKIPKRQFMGESQTLMNTLDEWLINKIVERFNAA